LAAGVIARTAATRPRSRGCAAIWSGWRRGRALGEVDGSPDPDPSPQRSSGPAERRTDTDHDSAVIAFLRRVRRALPGDPHFGDRLSATGSGGPEATARAAERMLGDDNAASRELSLAALQVWQTIRERRSGRPADEEITLVFTDLVGFSEWALQAGDDAMLRLLRLVRAGRRTAAAGSRWTGRQAHG
jgi:adenylate cyclase